jgi:hypothetical protein
MDIKLPEEDAVKIARLTVSFVAFARNRIDQIPG